MSAIASPFFTLEEAAQFARCSVRTIRRWLDEKKLTRYGLFKPLISKAELMALLSATPA